MHQATADRLLARAAALLGWPAPPPLSAATNAELLEALAGDLQGVLVCDSYEQATPPPAPPAAEPPPGPAAASPSSSLLPAAASEQHGRGTDLAVEPAGSQFAAQLQSASSSTLPPPATAPGGASPLAQPAADASPEPAAPPRRVLSVHTPAGLPPKLSGCPAVYLARGAGAGEGALSAEQLGAAVAATLLPAGPSLASLHQLLSLVVAPWLAAHQASAQAGGTPRHRSSAGSAADAVGGSTPASGGEQADEGEARASGSSSPQAGSSALPPPAARRGSQADAPPGPALPAAAELLAATHTFAGQASAAAKHLRSEVQMQLPAGVDLSDVAAAASSEDAVLACERCMEEWVLAVRSALQREGAASPEGRGPLPELEFWQARAEAYGRLLEQLGVPAVRAVVAVVERGSSDAALPASFKAQLSELGRLALEARDNARFLATLERHFRAVHTGSLAAVADAVQPMLNALRMIWIISRYYGDDVHMSNLLERIAQGLQDRLDGALDVASLFRAPAAESLALVCTCLAIARGWQAHYMAQRERIEASGHHARWEFSKALLFERTSHIAEVCGELEGMLTAVDDFRQFLGPELKAVTGNTSVIEEVSVMVSAMVEPVEGVAFNPFDKDHAADWRAVRARFARDADDVKLATRDLIDTCFRKLRSVDAAAQLLHSFQRIQAQGAMQQQMADKLAAVLEHFINEIAAVRRLFEEGREQPPLARNMPPVAGSIKWSRGLLVRLRRTWLRLQALNIKLEGLEPGRRAAAAMTDLAKDMLRYEKARFAAWSAAVEPAVTAGLQQPLLCRQAAANENADGGNGGGAAGGGGGSPGKAGGRSAVAINFPAGLLRLMREAKYLDQLGFAVPQLAVNLALQEGQIREHFQELGGMLERHAAAGASLRSAERSLLAEQLAGLEAALEPGLGRLNWTSLTISDFVAGVNKAVDQFTALVAQVQKNTSAIERTIYHITRARLVPADAPTPAPGAASVVPAAAAAPVVSTPTAAVAGQPEQQQQGSAAAGESGAAAAEPGAAPPAAEAAAEPAPAEPGQGGSSSPDVPDLQEFYEDFEQHRQQVVEGLVARYRSVGPLLIKIEELVAGTATGKSPRLAGYYAYWERRLFGAVCGMVVSALQALHDRMHACQAQGGAPEAEDAEAVEGRAAKAPLFRLSLSLLPPEVVVTPSAAEVGRQLSRLLRNLVESAKPFVRWMDGTCLEAPEQHVLGEDAEPFVFSFFSDVSQSPAVIRAMLGAQNEVQRGLAGVGKAAERWRGFGALWKTDRPAALAKFRARKPGHSVGEEKLGQYHRVGEDAWAAGGDHDVHFIRVRCAPLASSVRSEAQAWVRGIAAVLSEAEAPQLEALRQQAAALSAAVQLQPEVEADVARILAAISQAESAAPGATAACAELAERRRARWGYVVPEDAAGLRAELAAVEEVQGLWERLAEQAAARQREEVRLPRLGAVASLAEATAEESAARQGSAASRRRSAMPNRGSTLVRSASSASTASSAASKKRGPSRAKGAAPPTAGA